MFTDWLDNNNPPWTAYRAFMSGRLIVLDKNTDVYPVGVWATLRRVFDKCVLKVMVPKSTNAF